MTNPTPENPRQVIEAARDWIDGLVHALGYTSGMEHAAALTRLLEATPEAESGEGVRRGERCLCSVIGFRKGHAYFKAGAGPRVKDLLDRVSGGDDADSVADDFRIPREWLRSALDTREATCPEQPESQPCPECGGIGYTIRDTPGYWGASKRRCPPLQGHRGEPGGGRMSHDHHPDPTWPPKDYRSPLGSLHADKKRIRELEGALRELVEAESAHLERLDAGEISSDDEVRAALKAARQTLAQHHQGGFMEAEGKEDE